MTVPDARQQQLLFKILLAAALVIVAAAIVVPAGLGWDFANFYDTGRRAAHGQVGDIYDPATLIGGERPQGKMTFWGAPLSAYLYAPLGALPPGVALVVLKVACTVAYAVGLVVLYRQFRPMADQAPGGGGWYLPGFVAMVLVFQPFWTVYRVGGQTTPIVFLLLVVGLVAYQQGKMGVVAGALALAVLFKPAFVFVPVFLFLFSGPRFAVASAVVFLALAALSIALFGLGIHLEFLDVIRRGSAKPSPWPFNSSIYIVADAFRPIRDSIPVRGAGGWLPGALHLLLRVLVLGVIGRLVYRGWRSPWTVEGRRRFLYLGAVLFCLLFSQVVWEHYLVVLFIPLALLAAGRHLLDPGARAVLGAIFALAALQNLVFVLYFRDNVPITGTATLLAVSLVKAGPLLGTLYLLARYDESILRLIRHSLEPAPVATAGAIPVAATA